MSCPSHLNRKLRERRVHLAQAHGSGENGLAKLRKTAASNLACGIRAGKLHLLHSWNTVSRGLKMFLLWHRIAISPALSVFVMLAPARVSHAGNMQQCEAPIAHALLDPSYGPGKVVRLMLEALAHNNAPYKNAGIETAYRFASLANRRITGLLARFTLMLHSPTSNPMLNYMAVQYGPLQIIAGRVRQPVILPTRAGQRIGYIFEVSPQPAPMYPKTYTRLECEACQSA